MCSTLSRLQFKKNAQFQPFLHCRRAVFIYNLYYQQEENNPKILCLQLFLKIRWIPWSQRILFKNHARHHALSPDLLQWERTRRSRVTPNWYVRFIMCRFTMCWIRRINLGRRLQKGSMWFFLYLLKLSQVSRYVSHEYDKLFLEYMSDFLDFPSALIDLCCMQSYFVLHCSSKHGKAPPGQVWNRFELGAEKVCTDIRWPDYSWAQCLSLKRPRCPM